MKGLVRVLGNAALVVGGFFIVLFGTSRMSNQGAPRDIAQLGGLDSIAHADAPPIGGDSGGGDSGGGDSGGDSGDSGDSGK